MNLYVELSENELTELSGGCVWCRIGATIITVGGVVASGCNPVAIAFAVPSLVFTWAC